MNTTLERETLVNQLLNGYKIQEGATIYTMSESSSSGLTHYVRLFITAQDLGSPADIVNITYTAGTLLGWPVVDRNGRRYIKVSGGGMDMAFHTVYSLSSVLFAGQDRAGYVLNHRAL